MAGPLERSLQQEDWSGSWTFPALGADSGGKWSLWVRERGSRTEEGKKGVIQDPQQDFHELTHMDTTYPNHKHMHTYIAFISTHLTK